MDLENTLSAITSSAADLSQALSGVTAYIPEELTGLVKNAVSYIPAQVDLVSIGQFLLYFVAACLIFSVLSRIMLGKQSSLNSSLSSTLGILFIYVLTVVVYTFKPWNLEALLSPLPFVTFSGEYLILFPITDALFPALCQEILALVILAFLVNLTDVLLPRGESVISWYLMRLASVLGAMVLHILVRWALNTFLPAALVTYAPVILLILLAIMLFSGVLSFLLGLVIAVANPFLGAMYSFFFSNIVGKQVSKAVFTSAIIIGLFYLMERAGYTVICISAAALTAYIPLVLILLVLWYVIGHLL